MTRDTTGGGGAGGSPRGMVEPDPGRGWNSLDIRGRTAL